MKSVQQEIANLLSRHLSIQKGLKRGIINIRSLAKFLVHEYHLKYSLDAVISAIRRYDLENVSLLGSKEAEKIFAQMSVSTKDGVARLVLKDSAFKEVCLDFLNGKLLKENCRLIKSKETLTLIVAQKDLEKKLSLFKRGDILKAQKNLSEIRLQFAEDVGQIKGVIARLAGELATRDINIEEVIYSVPDLLFYVNEDDLIETHRTLMEIKKAPGN